ncbi:energy transducer TonB [uncultured Sulfuricurvum sp.]|uniref:energy transducer TonB n=1 Tax=uncultured Sulfuricurvum sp. TaxID=430693 RepID=UPI00261D6295|nr:energy transducer TonB [uncultured Sulfuricurvum sp.]
MYIRRSLLLSVGIHFTLIVSAIVLANIVHTPLPQSEKELILKVLLSPVAQKHEVTPVQPPVPAKKEPQPTIKPKPIQKIVPAPAMPSTVKPSIQPNPVPTPVVSQPAAAPTSVATAKTAESDTPKKTAPPPPPKVEENYEDNHLGEIRSILAERLKYPKNARRLNQQGEVSVTFTLSQNGEVSQIAITKSSGFDLLDEAARTLITAASPEFPKPSKSVRITVPISYTLR